MLVEYRNENPVPLRSPREILDAIVTVLFRAADSMLFGDIQEELGRQLGYKPPQSQTRIALRFLSSTEVGLVTRKRARYAAVDPKKIRQAARQAWDSIDNPT